MQIVEVHITDKVQTVTLHIVEVHITDEAQTVTLKQYQFKLIGFPFGMRIIMLMK